jgi:hypothetical protein
MLEMLMNLQEKGLRTSIVTGGGKEFVPIDSEQDSGVVPEQVVGSSIVIRYENPDGRPS